MSQKQRLDACTDLLQDVKISEMLEQYAGDLQELRGLLGSELDPEIDDIWMLRFLSRSTPAKAAVRLRAMMAWRKENNMAAIKAKIEAGMRPCDFPGYAAIARHFPQAAVHKTTRSGMPVTLELYGRADVQKLLEEMTAEEFFVYGLHRLEYLRLLLTNIAKTKGVYKQVCVVSDLGGLGWRHMHMPFINALKVVSLAAEEHYREQVGTVLVLNTNMVFSAIWKIVQPILNERTIAKIKIPAKSETEQVLQTYIDPADTPELLGGRCTCPATGGCLSGTSAPRVDTRSHNREPSQ
eukprot:TRINITY_DN3316_c0_g1_i4.p1 TRINITY_DN3316_c0_g1~~TRINITY_DN3316_c0_g1_i4.p1  ORF type:complete len:317 (-),score=81.12 TRINITY_DN3316_c0_g1_i4:31-915(-)